MQRVIALGFFDGVHLGHAGLLRTVRARAIDMGLCAAALTFDRHPMALVTGQSVPLINPRSERERLLREVFGMDEVRFLPFDRAMMECPWERFLNEVLLGELEAACLVCGHDYRFGFRGEGTAEKLRAACELRGIGCEVIPPIELDGITVSSTYIRQLIAAGDVARARRFLGHPASICGTVIHGSGIGRTMGTPTANLAVEPDILLPRRGVYISMAHTSAGDFPAVTNIGLSPTVDGQSVRVESWLPEFSGDLYGQTLRVDLWEYLRPERKFDNLSALEAEIKSNASEAAAYFARRADAESEEKP